MSELTTDALLYYSTQSSFSDPGSYSVLYDSLPESIEDLCRVIQGLCLHYMQGPLYGYDITRERLSEIDTRYTEGILSIIVGLDNRPLTEPRTPDKRFIGCCHDFALLLCSILRHRHIPARVRAGFAGYFAKWDPDFHCDHMITEYWNMKECRWCRCDPELDEITVTENGINFDIYDVPFDKFFTGGNAWYLCRNGKVDPDTFGVSGNGTMKGLPFVRGSLVHDLAALNKMELLNWDAWGLMLEGDNAMNTDNILSFDRAAALTEGGDDLFITMRKFYEAESGFRVPDNIMNFSPITGPIETTLRKKI